MAATAYVIRLTSPAHPRPLYVRRISRDASWTVTNDCARARRFEPVSAAQALRTLQPGIERAGLTPAVIPAEVTA